MRSTEETSSRARPDLQAWYLTSLQPKVERAAREGVVETAAADALDRQLRDFLELPADASTEAA